MADKKQKDEFDPNVETAALEQHVDQMMDPSLPDPEPIAPSKQAGAPELPKLDIFAAHDDTDADGIADKPATKPRNKPSAAPAAVATSAPALPGSAAAKDETADKIAETPAPTDIDTAMAPDNKSIPKSEGTIAEQLPGYPPIDEEAADSAVDDIVARESDVLLEVQDGTIGVPKTTEPPRQKHPIKAFFAAWWHNRWARYGTLAFLLLGAVTAGIVPASRYYLLNTAGVRVGATMTVIDGTTDLPLKNVSVTVGTTRSVTNADGIVRLKDLTLGEHMLTVHQIGFAKVSHTVTLGLGSNPLGDTELKATGVQYTFRLTDYLSGKPVKNAEINSGEANAQSDDKGIVVLTLGKIEAPTLTAAITAGGYRSEKVVINSLKAETTNLTMVTKRKDVFVSKQSGKYDLYKIDIDGKNKQLLLAGTGLERNQMTLVSHPMDEKVALVSSREDKRNGDGYLFDTLTIIDVEKGTTLSLEHSERIQIVDWIGDRLVYVKIKAGTSAGNPDRQQLMSYNLANTNRQILASANNFADLVSTKGVIYFAASNTYNGGKSYFAKVNPDTTGKQTLQEGEVWNIIRHKYDGFYLASTNDWYGYKPGDPAAKKLDKAPNNPYETRFYLDAPDGKRALWTDSRDGKGVLLAYDATTGKDKVLVSQTGLSYPLRWLDSRTALYRIATPNESASYVISLDGGMPRKITDVTNVGGLGRWFSGF